MPDHLMDAVQIRQYLSEVADLLGEGPPCIIVVAGGSLLALHELRQATRDVDSIKRLDAAVRTAAAEVANRHGLPRRWLNDNAAAWWPSGLTEGMCEVELERGRLRVLRVPLKYLFVMKLEAHRAADAPDLRRAWPYTGFTSAEEAAELWHASYPQQDPDPFLARLHPTGRGLSPSRPHHTPTSRCRAAEPRGGRWLRPAVSELRTGAVARPG